MGNFYTETCSYDALVRTCTVRENENCVNNFFSEHTLYGKLVVWGSMRNFRVKKATFKG